MPRFVHIAWRITLTALWAAAWLLFRFAFPGGEGFRCGGFFLGGLLTMGFGALALPLLRRKDLPLFSLGWSTLTAITACVFGGWHGLWTALLGAGVSLACIALCLRLPGKGARGASAHAARKRGTAQEATKEKQSPVVGGKALGALAISTLAVPSARAAQEDTPQETAPEEAESEETAPQEAKPQEAEPEETAPEEGVTSD